MSHCTKSTKGDVRQLHEWLRTVLLVAMHQINLIEHVQSSVYKKEARIVSNQESDFRAWKSEQSTPTVGRASMPKELKWNQVPDSPRKFLNHIAKEWKKAILEENEKDVTVYRDK